MYSDIIFFNNGDRIFKHISDISIYITSVIYLWCLTSLNKHEHCTFQNQNATQVIYMSVFLKGTDCRNSFDGIFILSDKVAFMSELLRLQPLPGKTLVLPLSSASTGRQSDCISIISPSPATCSSCYSFFIFFLQQLTWSQYNVFFFWWGERNYRNDYFYSARMLICNVTKILISDRCCSSELSIHRRNLKNSTRCFQHNNKCFLSSKSEY